MSVKLCLKLMAIISTNCMYSKRKLADYIIDEVDCILLRMLLIDLKSTYSCCIINGCILESSNFLPFTVFQFEELDINLYVVTWNLLFIAMCQYCSSPFIPGKSIDSMPLKFRYTVISETLSPL